MIVNASALPGLIMPAGISLTAVRGFIASYLASSQRLYAMAAERAKIMQRITSKNLFIKIVPSINAGNAKWGAVGDGEAICQPGTTETANSYLVSPKKKPISANGIAKMVCEKVTKER